MIKKSFLLYLVCSFIFFLPIGCINKNTIHKPKSNWQKSFLSVNFPKEEVRSITIILHGLNYKPSNMLSIARLMNDQNSVTLIPALQGHEPDAGVNIYGMKHVSAQNWHDGLKRAIVYAKQLQTTYDVPIYFIGYSLGGLLGTFAAAQSEFENIFAKMILLAPAIVLPDYSYFLQRVFKNFKDETFIFSPAPDRVKVMDGSSIGAYRSLLQINERLLLAQKNSLQKLPTLIITDPHDEVIPFVKLKDFVLQNKLSLWQFALVNNTFAKENYGFRHLIADKESLGKEGWLYVSSLVVNFLQQK